MNETIQKLIREDLNKLKREREKIQKQDRAEKKLNRIVVCVTCGVDDKKRNMLPYNNKYRCPKCEEEANARPNGRYV